MIDDVRPPKRAPAVDGHHQLQPLRPHGQPQNQNQPQPEPFLPPEAVAARGAMLQPAPGAADEEQQPSVAGLAPTLISHAPHGQHEPVKVTRFTKFKPHWPPGRYEAFLASLVVLLLIAGGAGWQLTHRTHKVITPAAKVVVKPKPVAPPQPTTVPSALSGLPVDPSINQRPVTGVMIENSLAARPQAGLGQASVVFEAIAEGGITRFLALFQDNQPENVGPIRSSRPYYLQWALGFDAGYAHVGGSPEALRDIKSWGVRDLDQFYNSSAYHRISSRAAPHNVYSALSLLNKLEASKGYNTSTFTSLTRKAKEAPAATPTAKSINFNLSGYYYNVHYDYDAASNSYKRSEGGKPHIDANTNAQISPKVVVGLVMPYALEADHYHSTYNTIGSGTVYVFQDGTVTKGTWTKTDNKSQFVFKDEAGNPIGLNPGQTWLTMLSSSSNVTYTP